MYMLGALGLAGIPGPAVEPYAEDHFSERPVPTKERNYVGGPRDAPRKDCKNA